MPERDELCFIAISAITLFRVLCHLPDLFLQDPENSFMDGMQIEDIGKWPQATNAVNPITSVSMQMPYFQF